MTATTHPATSTGAPPDFYVVAYEPGAEHPALPTWANHNHNPAKFDESANDIATHRPIDDVPGAFHVVNALSSSECERLVNLTEEIGYLADAAVSLPRSIRHNDNITWLADDETVDILWQRCADALNQQPHLHFGKRAVGLNARWRFYRYREGDYFAPHTDGGWFGSAVIDGELVVDAFGDRYSQLSFVLFLSDGFDGGRTEFYVDPDSPDRPARDAETSNRIAVTTPIGAALCFPHGMHPWHCLHSSETIRSGTKYIVRTDVLFEV